MKERYMPLFFAVVFLASSAIAEESRYGGISYHAGRYDTDGFQAVDASALGMKLGLTISEYLSFEGHYAYGLKGDSVSHHGVEVDTDLSSAISVFAKGRYSVNDWMNVYGLAGFSHVAMKAKVSSPLDTEVQSDGDLSLGLGIGAEVYPSYVVQLEYINYLMTNSNNYSAINLGFIKIF